MPPAPQWGRACPAAELDERDPDYIRENLPLLWLACSLWYRGEVRGLSNVPEDGPVLLVGNHSGGNMTPDTLVFTLAFSTHFGVERRFHQLAHNLVVSMPLLSFLRRYGTVAASHEPTRQRALEAGAAVLVYPGGDWEVHRPSWQGDRIDFAGRTRMGAPGAATTTCRSSPSLPSAGRRRRCSSRAGSGIAQRADARQAAARLKVLPVSIALPWVINVGDVLGHLPSARQDHDRDAAGHPPAPGVRPRSRRRRDLRVHVTRLMQETLDALAVERRLPVLG